MDCLLHLPDIQPNLGRMNDAVLSKGAVGRGSVAAPDWIHQFVHCLIVDQKQLAALG
jgi:hypothetical protein